MNDKRAEIDSKISDARAELINALKASPCQSDAIIQIDVKREETAKKHNKTTVILTLTD